MKWNWKKSGDQWKEIVDGKNEMIGLYQQRTHQLAKEKEQLEAQLKQAEENAETFKKGYFLLREYLLVNMSEEDVDNLFQGVVAYQAEKEWMNKTY